MLSKRLPMATLAVLFLLSPRAGAEEIKFTLLHINDVYEILPPRPGDPGGLARVAALRASLKEQTPGGHAYAVLAGDAVSPSVMGFAEISDQDATGKTVRKRLAGRQMVEVLNAMGLDLATFGNHEFDLKAQEFRDRLSESRFAWFSSNTSYSSPASPWDVPTHQVLRIPGKARGCELKVGLLGVTLNFKSEPNKPNYVALENPIRAATAEVARLKAEGCQVIVALTHLQLEEDQLLAARVPGIHLIMGGHEHQRHYEPPAEKGLPPIAKADANARSAYIHEFTYDTEGGRLTVASQLRFIDDRSDPPAGEGKATEGKGGAYRETSAAIDRWKGIAFDAIREEIRNKPDSTKARVVEALRGAGVLTGDLANDRIENPIFKLGVTLDGREANVRTTETNLTKMLTRLMREKSGDGTHLSIVNSGSIRIDDIIPASGISLYDIFRILPYEVKVYRVKMRGDLLKRLLKAGHSEAVRKEGSFLQVGNYDFEKGRLIEPSVAVEDDKFYDVAIADYLLTGQEKDLQDVLPPRDLTTIFELPPGGPLFVPRDENDKSKPKYAAFDLLPEVARELATLAKPPDEGARKRLANLKNDEPQIIEPEGAAKATEETAREVTFDVPAIPCREEEDRRSDPVATSKGTPLKAMEMAPGLKAALEQIAAEIHASAMPRETGKSSIAETPGGARTAPGGSGDRPLDWATVLLIFAVAGFVGGGLSTLQYIELAGLVGPRRGTQPISRLISGWRTAIFFNAIGGIGGAFAALFVMILDKKIPPTLGDLDKLTYAATGVVAGFLGLQLLKLASGALVKAAKAAVGEEVKDMERNLEKKVEKVENRVDVRLNKMADAAARAYAGTANPANESPTERQARADLMSAIIRGRLAQTEPIDPPKLDALIGELEQGLQTFPRNREAIIVLGQLYAKKRGDLEQGIAVLKRGLAALTAPGANSDPIDIADIHYNLACYYSLQYAAEADAGRRATLRDQALTNLVEALKNPHNLVEARTDPDFRSLGDDPKFQALIGGPSAPPTASA